MKSKKKIDGKIYLITNIVNGRQYVGSTKQLLKIRIDAHFNNKHSGTPLMKRAINKWGKNGFTVEQIDSANTIKELNDKEIYWIKKSKTLAPNGYNMLPGGYTNEAATEARKRPVQCIDTGKIYDSLIEASEKTNTPRYLITFCCNGRQDTANGLTFVYVDKKLKRKADIKRRKRKSTNVGLKKKVLNIDTGEVYGSMFEASRKTGISRSTVRRLCNGEILDSKGRNLVFFDKKLRNEAKITKNTLVLQNFNRNGILCVTTKEKFSSASKASEKFNLSVTTIIKNCLGKPIKSDLVFVFLRNLGENKNV